MAKQVVGLFDNMQDAHSAVSELTNAGFTSDDISIVANNSSGQSANYDADTGSEAGEGAGAGAVGGAVLGGLGGLLVGLGALAIPGVGPVIAAGTLATALGTTAVGAGLGAAAGGLVGALVGAGIPEEDANIYAEGVRRGGALVTVQAATDSDADRAADILDRYNVVDIDDRGSDYRSSGWSRFDENDTSYGTGDNDRSAWGESSKVGTAGGTLAGAGTGAAIGSVGGPVGTVVGGIAGAVTGAGVGAAGDAAGESASDAATGEDDMGRSRTGSGMGTDYSTTDRGGMSSDRDMTDRGGMNTADSDQSEWAESSKVGTAGGGVAGAATGAAIGSVGGPVGTVIGGVAGALTGAGVGAAGDAAGESASDAAMGEDDSNRSRTGSSSMGTGAAMGSATDYGTTERSTMGSTSGRNADFQSGTREHSAEQGETTIPVIEEEIRVGKRDVESGGVRVNTRVEETPVNEQVSLRDETVTVERRRVDQPADASTTTDAFREGTFEVREHDEEAMVQKDARVVEEIVINKDVEQRTENIQDTVRRTDVDVEQIQGETRTSGYTETGRTSSGTMSDASSTEDEGAIERGASRAGNAVERGTGLDLDRDGDTGRRDPRNNI